MEESVDLEETLLGKYLELQKEKEKLECDMEMIKSDFEKLLEKRENHKYISSIGEARMMKYMKSSFDSKKAKTFLSPQQIVDCTKEKEIVSITIMSTQAIENRRSFLKK
jgi:hypothetical protein